MNDRKPITTETIIYFLIFILAITFRGINLYHAPLSDMEASIALQAKDLITGGGYQNFSDQPLLVNLLGLSFSLFGLNTFFTRIVPLLSGSLIVFLPSIFRKELGKRIAILIAGWLAVDPLFYLLSRKVDSTLLSLIFFFVIIKFYREKKWVWVGVIAAFGLLSGVQFIVGLFILCMLFLVSGTRIFSADRSKENKKPEIENNDVETNRIFGFKLDWKIFLTGFIPVIFLLSTMFFMFPDQFGAISNSLVSFVVGFGKSSETSIVSMFSGLLVYEPFVFFVGLFGIVYFWKSKGVLFQILKFWSLIALLFVIIYPNKSVSSLVWLILPLSILSIKLMEKLIKSLQGFGEYQLIFPLVMFVLIIFLFLFVFSAGNLSVNVLGLNVSNIMLTYIAILLFLLTIVLIGWAWSWELSRSSLLSAACLLWIIGSISSAWGLGGGKSPFQNELWNIGNPPPDAKLIAETVEQMAALNNKSPEEVKIVISEIKPPSLLWNLKDYQTEIVEAVYQPGNADIIITPYESISQIQGYYTGQDFVNKSEPAWNLMTLSEIKHWYLTREAPQDSITQETIILWFNTQWFAKNN